MEFGWGMENSHCAYLVHVTFKFSHFWRMWSKCHAWLMINILSEIEDIHMKLVKIAPFRLTSD
jgi:hypothetical protein